MNVISVMSIETTNIKWENFSQSYDLLITWPLSKHASLCRKSIFLEKGRHYCIVPVNKRPLALMLIRIVPTLHFGYNRRCRSCNCLIYILYCGEEAVPYLHLNYPADESGNFVQDTPMEAFDFALSFNNSQICNSTHS